MINELVAKRRAIIASGGAAAVSGCAAVIVKKTENVPKAFKRHFAAKDWEGLRSDLQAISASIEVDSVEDTKPIFVMTMVVPMSELVSLKSTLGSHLTLPKQRRGMRRHGRMNLRA